MEYALGAVALVEAGEEADEGAALEVGAHDPHILALGAP